jgi:hypothetical protein
VHDGWPYVLACYLVAALTLGAWFAMIGVKLRRQRQQQVTTREEQPRG